MTGIFAGIIVMVFAAIMYPFWPDSAFLGNLWSSLVMGGVGIFTVLIGAWWNSLE